MSMEIACPTRAPGIGALSGNGVPEHREYKDRATPESVGEGPQHSAADKLPGVRSGRS
jgi:hypothetical protein